MPTETVTQALTNPDRWGLSAEAIESLPTALQKFWQRYAATFGTAPEIRPHMSALLRMKANRCFAESAGKPVCRERTFNNFVSNSPQSARPIYRQIQAEIAATPALCGSVLLIDDSADAKSGSHSAGASRQYNGRLGKGDLYQSGVFLTWAWVDAELYLPKEWFAPEGKADRDRVGIPPERVFQTKPQLAQQMIARPRQNGLLFAFVGCDELYGRKDEFRSWMAQEQMK